MPMDTWGAVFDPATATPRRFGPQMWHVLRLCDGERSGRELCEALEASGSSSGEALMALAQVLATGIVEL